MVSFPTSLDSFTNPTSSDSLNTTGVLHDVEHSDANDAIEALEAKVGIDSSAVTTSLDYKVARGAHSSLAYGRMSRTSDQTISQVTLTVISWQAEDADTDSMVDIGGNPTRLKFTTAGLYLVMVQSSWANNSTGFRFVEIQLNSAGAGSGTTLARDRRQSTTGSGETEAVVSTIYNAAANDYVEVYVYHAAGGNLNFDYTKAYLSAIRLG